MRFWHLECQDVHTDADHITEALKKRFRPFAHSYGVDCQLAELRMRELEYNKYRNKFNELAA